jgi:glycosyltransferase involved in cell wall biosynthesis
MATVIYPPVDTDFFTPNVEPLQRDFFLYAGRLVAYKRPDLAVRAADLAGVPLVVAGSGPELRRLRRLGGSRVEFRPEPSDHELRDLYRRARAVVFPGVEDFGMTLVEAQACGTPVIALAKGGALEAVADGETGLLYADDSVEELAAAMTSFDTGRFQPEAIRRHAERFSRQRFEAAIRSFVESIGESSVSRR